MASCTLLFDQRKLNWSDEMLALSGIDRRLLCDAFPSGTVLGEVTPAAAAATGLAAGTPVVLGGHDYLCGALPVGAFKPGVILDVSGTWEIVLASTPAPVLTPAGAADRRDRRGARGARPLRHLGRRGLVRHAGVVSQGVRLRGEAPGRGVLAAWTGTI